MGCGLNSKPGKKAEIWALTLSLAYSTPPMEKFVHEIFQQNARYICIQAHENKAGASHPFRQMGICPTKNLLWKKDKRNKRKEGKKKKKKSWCPVHLETNKHYWTKLKWPGYSVVSPWKVMAFSSRARIGGECSTIHYPPALFFFKVEISSRTLIPL